MATLSQSECRRLYSWWWDSHNSPKNSKWLQENLTDIDTKVKSMIKLIEEEADSFARRAEMYYKKRPELMKLVEEFYRAYRALAERYDHAMGELRHAQKTMPEAFPNSAHYILNDDSPCSSLGPEAQSPGPGFSRPVHRSKNNERSSEESDGEVQTLRETMSKMQYDKDALFVQYQKSLEKLSKMESDLNKAQDDAEGLDERASKAEIEVEILKESLKQLKAEKDAGEIQYNQCLASIARLETMLSLAQLEAKGFDDRAARAEIEAKNLKQELTRMEAQKDTVFLPYKLCLEKIPMLEGKITLAEENSRMLNEQIERAELEVKALRKKLTELNEEKESLAFLYNECLKKISSMENEILHAQENAEQLKKSNQNLQLEAENLVQKIALKDQEVLEKHTEIERLKTLMHGEHSHFIQIESALQTLQKLYSQSQQEQRNLSLELKYGLLTLKDLELTKQDFKEEMREIMEENKTLHELNFSSTRSLKKQQMEISKLKEIKEKLEREFSVNAEESNALQLETHQIKDDIQYLNERYQAMLEQLQSLGLNPNSLAGSVKKLQDENSMLKEACQMEQGDKEALREKSKDMDEILIENAFIEFSLLRQNDELDGLRGTVREIQQLCQVLREEKSILVDEKTALLSQLQVMTESMQKLMEKNSLLEESLSDAKIEFEGLRTKSDDLEECCKLLNDEKNNLINERSMLISQLEMVEAKLSNLEKKVTSLEEKYANVEKEKESAGNQVEELRLSILAQKEKHSNHKHSSEARLANLENLVRVLQEEQLLGKVEFEQELDKAVNAQIEMFILQNCIEELELKNLFLLTECEKLVEMSKFSDKIIMELESENLVQLIEEEFLLHRIRKFKMDIHKVCGVLQIDSGGGCDSGIKQEEIPISRILEKIEGFESSLVKSEEENQHLLVENSVLLASLQQHQSVGEKLKSEKKIMEQEFEDMREQNAILQKDKVELLEENRQLRIKVVNGEEKENRSKSTLVALHAEMTDLRRTNQVYQEESGKMLEEKNSLLKSVLDLKDAMSSAEDGNNVMFHEVLALSNLNLVYESFLTEKAVEQQVLCEHLGNLSHLNNDLNQELGVLRKNLKLKEAENVFLNESTERMGKELMEMEKRLKAAETLNAEFPRHIEELKMEQEDSRLIKENLDNQILELSENCMNHKKEIEHLNDANESLQSELESLSHEVEKHRVKEETLSLELLNKSNEFKLWENEATAFYYDLQMSSICGTLLESKVTELTGVCKRLDDESSAKSMENEHMRERISLLEKEIGGLKGKLSSYVPVVSSLKEDFASLEHISLLWTNRNSAVSKGVQKDVVIGTSLQERSHQSLRENESVVIPDGVSDLLTLQTRIREVEKIMMEELKRRVRQKNLTTEGNGYSALDVGTYPKIDTRKKVTELKEESTLDHNTWRKKPKIRLLMKDIPLDRNVDDRHSKYWKREHRRTDDHMLELSETNDHDSVSAPIEDVIICHLSDNSGRYLNYSSELDIEKELGVDKLELSKTVKEKNEDDKRRRILERLVSDSQKLAILKMALQDLKKKTETKKKSKQGSDFEYETVKRHIEEVEEAVTQQSSMNDQMAKNVEEGTSSSLDREIPMELEKYGHVETRRMTEQARRGSEQIGRLQFEVQNIQYILLKLSEENNITVKNRISGKTGILLREFIQIGRINSKRRRKLRVCGCSKPSTNED